MWNLVRSIFNSVAALVIGMLLETFTDSLNFSIPIRIGLIVVLGVLSIINTISAHKRIQAKPKTYKVPSGKEAKTIHKGKKGLILTVSLPEPSIDWEQPIPSTSRLHPLFSALKAHASSLDHLWFLGTADSPGAKGSSSIFEDLKAYLLRNKTALGLKNNIEIHFLDPIEMSEDYLVTECVRKTVDEVFNKRPKGLKESDIVADCTGGTKSMTLGVILACLEENRDLQLIGSKYKEDGRPDSSSSFPIIFEYSTSRAEYNK